MVLVKCVTMRKKSAENRLCTRSASLRGTRKLAYLDDMSRMLRAVRLAAHRARLVFQRFSIAFMIDRSAC